MFLELNAAGAASAKEPDISTSRNPSSRARLPASTWPLGRGPARGVELRHPRFGQLNMK